MNADEIRALCLSLPGSTEEIQWGDDLLFKVAGKMFVCMGISPDSRYSLKCPEDTFHELTEQSGIAPAPYLARAHWVQIDPGSCDLSSDEIVRLIRQSYELVVAKLPKKIQATLDTGNAKKAARARTRTRK